MRVLTVLCISAVLAAASGCATHAPGAEERAEASLYPAYFNPDTGEVFVPRPGEPGVAEWVGVIEGTVEALQSPTPGGTGGTSTGSTPPKTCVTRTETVCAERAPSASSYSGFICVRWATVTTVTCT